MGGWLLGGGRGMRWWGSPNSGWQGVQGVLSRRVSHEAPFSGERWIFCLFGMCRCAAASCKRLGDGWPSPDCWGRRHLHSGALYAPLHNSDRYGIVTGLEITDRGVRIYESL